MDYGILRAMTRRTGWIGLLAVPLSMALVGSSVAGPPQDDSPQADGSTAQDEAGPSQGADQGPPPPDAVAPSDVPAFEQDIEERMAELSVLVEDVTADGDPATQGCVEDKLDRGRDVVELATAEVLVARDTNATTREKSFAAEKVKAAAQRMALLVRQARACSGEGDDDGVSEGDNDVDAPSQIPIADPTAPGADPPVPPAVDDHRPVTVASPEA